MDYNLFQFHSFVETDVAMISRVDIGCRQTIGDMHKCIDNLLCAVALLATGSRFTKDLSVNH